MHACALAPWLQQYCYKFSFSFLNCEQRESIRMGGRQMEKVCLACLSTFHHCPFASLLLALLLVVPRAFVYFVLNTFRSLIIQFYLFVNSFLPSHTKKKSYRTFKEIFSCKCYFLCLKITEKMKAGK